MTVQVPGGTDYFQVFASSWTSGSATIAIEASNAQGITMVIQPSGASLQTTTKLNDASGNSIYNGQNTMANSLPVVIASNQTAIPISGNVITSPTDGIKTSYSASITGLSAPNSATDIFTITGSASKIIRVTRVAITATQTTAAQRDVVLVKRSSANTAGTSTAPTKVAHDSTNAAATAVVAAYTANPTLGTLVGAVRTRKVFIGTATGNSDECIFDFGIRPTQAVVLRGVAEVLSVNMNGVTSAGNSYDISIEWSEE
jgi:hypothetical protein